MCELLIVDRANEELNICSGDRKTKLVRAPTQCVYIELHIDCRLRVYSDRL
jgi:hypothetical protein